jgi:hypothetical protein
MESFPDPQTLEKGDTMKGLVTVTVITLLCGTLAIAGPLEFFAGAGPSAATLGSINDGIETVNNIIRDLNNDPRYEGDVPELGHLGSGLAYSAGERYWITDRFALGGKLTYFRAATVTSGAYETVNVTEVSNVSLDLKTQSIGLLVSAKFVFLDVGLRLAADLGVGYYYSGFETAITFEMPSSYAPISIELPSGDGHYNGSSFGIEGGISLYFPIADWVNVGTSVLYRSLTVQHLRDSEGRGLDFDGDGTTEVADLGGITVEFTIALNIDISL